METNERQILICQAPASVHGWDWLDQKTLKHPDEQRPLPDLSGQMEFAQIENYVQDKTKVPGGFLSMDGRSKPNAVFAYVLRLARQSEPTLDYEEKWLRKQRGRDPQNPYLSLGLADLLMCRALKKALEQEAASGGANLADPQIQSLWAESNQLLLNIGAERPMYSGVYFPMSPFYNSPCPPQAYYAGAQSQAALRRMNYGVIMSTLAFQNQEPEREGNLEPAPYPPGLPSLPLETLPPLPGQADGLPPVRIAPDAGSKAEEPARLKTNPYTFLPTDFMNARKGGISPIWQHDAQTNIQGKPFNLPALQPRFQNRPYFGQDGQSYNYSW